MKFGVVVFPGSNCDMDMVYVLKNIMQEKVIKLWHKENDLQNCDVIVLPGGFSFGDYLRCGALAARSPVISAIKNHISRGGAVLGVCNGFQILIEAKILPGSLIRNKKLLFTCRETTLEVQSCIENPFLSGLKIGECLKIPVAHNEGNYFAPKDLLKQLKEEGRIALKYIKQKDNEKNYNPNGSTEDIAGILSNNGRVLGMMPHPERAINYLHGGTDGLKLLTNCVEQIIS